MNLFNDPKSVKINMSNLSFDQIEYWEPSGLIDKAVFAEMKMTYNEELAAQLHENYKMYFLVLKNREYDIVSGIDLTNILNEVPVSIDSPVISKKAQACKKHFIKYLVKLHKKAAEKAPVLKR